MWVIALGIACAFARAAAQTRGGAPVNVRQTPALAPPIPSLPPAAQPHSPSVAPTPANITFVNGLLSIQANGSSLDQILREVGRVSGMVVHGSPGNSPVYGLYGPRDPREVLSELLSGTGVNVMMTGSTDRGAPRELVLTAKTGPPSAPGAGPVDVPTMPAERPQAVPPTVEVPAPAGANAAPPGPPRGSEDPEERRQQNLRRLQHMQERQKPEAPPR
jgi:hypothetical protein